MYICTVKLPCYVKIAVKTKDRNPFLKDFSSQLLDVNQSSTLNDFDGISAQIYNYHQGCSLTQITFHNFNVIYIS